MSIYKIADLTVDMRPREERLKKQSEAYKYCDILPDGAKADIIIPCISDRDKAFQKENPHLTLDECEYILCGADFYHGLIDYDGLLLHSSAVVYRGRTYMFSAPSGTGKSTHTGLWLKRFGDEAFIINDDKPAIRIKDGKFRVYGTPFSGKTDINVNTFAELQGICILERGEKNSIKRISTGEALRPLLSQTLRPVSGAKMDKMLSTVDRLVKSIPIFRMQCNISEEAAEMAYRAMSFTGDEEEIFK